MKVLQNDENYALLKQVLSVPTKTYQEDRMVEYITNWLTENNITWYIDSMKNIYATKKTDDVEYYPCVISHTDTVHSIDSINVKEEMLPDAQKNIKLSLKAYNDSGKPTGIGGDDKCGVFACLTILKELPNVKAAFFVSEETGCHGSSAVDMPFFDDVGYAIQFDAPENWMITEFCWGTQLFERKSEFFEKCDKVLTESMPENRQYMKHPYTDVHIIKQKFNFPCINFSIGYYDYHTKNEYVVVDDVYSGMNIGIQMIESLGYTKHVFINKKHNSRIF